MSKRDEYMQIIRRQCEVLPDLILGRASSGPWTAQETRNEVLKAIDLFRERVANLDPQNPIEPKYDETGFYENEPEYGWWREGKLHRHPLDQDCEPACFLRPEELT